MQKNAVFDAKVCEDFAKIWQDFDQILTKFPSPRRRSTGQRGSAQVQCRNLTDEAAVYFAGCSSIQDVSIAVFLGMEREKLEERW